MVKRGKNKYSYWIYNGTTKKYIVTLLALTCLMIWLILNLNANKVEIIVYFPDLYKISKPTALERNRLDGDLMPWFHRQPPKRQACIHPQLDTEETRKSKSLVPGITCGSKKEWVFTHGGKFFIAAEAVHTHGIISCDYMPIVKSDNDRMEYGPIVKNVANNTKLVSDYFKVTCKAKDGATYNNVHNGIKIRDDLVGQRTNEFGRSGMGVSVLLYGIDSLSRPMYQVQLPKTHDYFINKLGGSLLEGYNIVGDGTTQALAPLLTGKEETQLPETRRGYQGAQNVDVYPFIWKDFEKEGFVTQFNEDMPESGTFAYRLLGFHAQPVHHYMRPFYFAVSEMNTKNDYCLGAVPRYKLALDNVQKTFDAYKGIGQFSFIMHGEMSHDDNNLAQTMDDGNVEFLKYLDEKGYFNSTVLVLFSDHGARFSKNRASERGKLEERMPYFGLRFPSWFYEKYPTEMANFKSNTKRLTSPYDIHATLKHLLYHRKPIIGDIQNLGISLFDEIPPERTCNDAHIEPHWCACMNWLPISVKDIHIVSAVNSVLDLIRQVLEPFKDKCSKLKVKTIKFASMFSVNKDLLKFKSSKDIDGRVPDLSGHMEALEVLYRVTFTTTPGDGLFEATVNKNMLSNIFKADEKSISRLNMYGDAPNCIKSQAPHLRPYCFCVNT